MRPLSVPHQEAAGLLRAQLSDFVAAASLPSDLSLLGASRCHGWSRLDVVVHVRAGLEEVVGGCAAQTDRAPDHDAASYWSLSLADGQDHDPVPPILWLRRTASAYGRPHAAVRHLRDVVARLGPALERMPDQPVEFQGTVMASGDFLTTWVVELVVHQLDLDVDAPPRLEALALARTTVEAVAGAGLPAALDDRTAVLVGLGREPVPEGGPDVVPEFPLAL